MSKQEDKEKILELVKEYALKYHQVEPYQEGDYIAYAKRVYDEHELMNLVDASLDFWLTSGPYTEKFEKALGDYLNLPFVSLVNSGSSANFLALACLTSPELEDRRLLPGDEVITVACGFPTTINPIIQLGLVPVFLDVTIPEYNIDTSKLEEALSPKTKCIFLAHSVGNPFDIETIKAFCDTHGLWLIEDNCDALGSEYTLEGKKKCTGTFGDIGTSSFYPAHHITTGEGGAVYTKNPLLHKIVRSLRDWGRDCICPPGLDNICRQRFSRFYENLPQGYDHKYVYSHFGYNLKATDLQASIGLAQMDKLPSFSAQRKENFKYFNQLLIEGGAREWLILPEATKNSDPSWFCYPMTTKEGVDCVAIVKALEEAKIQTRRLFAGNFIKQPCFDDIRANTDKYRVVGELKNTDYIMEHTFLLGLYPGMQKVMLEEMANTLLNVLKNL